ncbi:peptidase C14, caspase catalytic subunit P20 [Catenulispora acidiphila DSM 44928]|uniref:Peptidase C14, caspase catalytic subunit P20 n=1 Tax=Catenulispora acidiphila (strain DSM 44928 / JCM 14897 / NBRC 102108 / NRRL B-24433 / ID139908) TaxID=479433 RepID=C7Q3C5_CATAD|nr:hypothetical protein [Catenulispora acidiphila]ACU73861.1 peptidase C14, caspase catalytic subunit P20 [Catenulispora acidiphila DSM 44928]
MPKGFAELGVDLYVRRTMDQRMGMAPPRSDDKGLLPRGLVPCLVTVLRLSAHQKADEGAGMDLASALVSGGHLARAVDVVRSARRFKPADIVALALMAGRAGDLDGAHALIETITDRSLHDDALVAFIPVLAHAGERERAVAMAEKVRYPHNWPGAWEGLAKAVADCGDFPAALGYAAKAAEDAGGVPLGRVLLTSMEIAHAAGDDVLAKDFADRVEDLVRNGDGQRSFLVTVLAFEAGNGDLERLDAVLHGLIRAAAEDVAAQESQEAEDNSDFADLYLTIIPRPRPPFGAEIVPELLEAVTETADREVAVAVADRVGELLRSGAPFDGSALREALILLLARHGQVERAIAYADRIVEPNLRAARHADIVEALARSGDTDRAETLARALTSRWARSRALIAVVHELAWSGETARAEALVSAIPDRWGRGEALVEVAAALARQGEPERAEDLAHTIRLGRTRARALSELAYASDDQARARRLAARAVFLGGWTMALGDLEAIVPGGALAIADALRIPST